MQNCKALTDIDSRNTQIQKYTCIISRTNTNTTLLRTDKTETQEFGRANKPNLLLMLIHLRDDTIVILGIVYDVSPYGKLAKLK